MPELREDEFDATRFAVLFSEFLEAYRALLPPPSGGLRAIAARHLGVDPATLSALTRRFDASDHVNLQLALNALTDASGSAEVIGLPAEILNYGGFSLASLVGGRFHGPNEPASVEYLDLAIDVDKALPCARLALYLLAFDGSPVVAMAGIGERHGPHPDLVIEVIAREDAAAQLFITRVVELMDELNVYRGKVLSFTFSDYGHFGLAFHRVPTIGRDDIVLPEADLAAIERHTVGLAAHADALRAAGRHIKRGLLLYGPPGAGKTLSVMHLCNRMPGRTVVILSGQAAPVLGRAAALARRFQPSMMVLEDVDLVAHERTMPGMDTNPLLFQLLNEMDGLEADADVIFVLTTNRIELLEPALAARPGRIDQAVEIRLPDADCRRRLFDLYLRGLDAELVDLDQLIARTDGVSAAFVRELVRRAALAAAEADGGAITLSTSILDAALDDLLEHSAPVLRSMLGASGQQGR